MENSSSNLQCAITFKLVSLINAEARLVSRITDRLFKIGGELEELMRIISDNIRIQEEMLMKIASINLRIAEMEKQLENLKTRVEKLEEKKSKRWSF